jgi:ParB family transcriptional regulator, chromosome partitioning protein
VSKLAKMQAGSRTAALAMTQRFLEVDRLGQQQIDLALIDPDPDQPRRDFDPEAMAVLTLSIERHGVLQPIMLVKIAERFQIVAGERRYRACVALNKVSIPAVVHESLSDVRRLEIQLVENLSRSDLNPLERVDGMLNLIALRAEQPREAVLEDWRKRYSDSTARTQISDIGDEVLSQFGVALSTAYRQFQALERMDEAVRTAIRQGSVHYSVGVLLASVRDADQRFSLLAECVNEGLSHAQLEQRVKALAKPREAVPRVTPTWQARLTRVGKLASKGNRATQTWFEQRCAELEEELAKRIKPG